jgi:hypothetical protein
MSRTIRIALALFDIVISVPFATIIYIYALRERPPWFMNMIDAVYADNQNPY